MNDAAALEAVRSFDTLDFDPDFATFGRLGDVDTVDYIDALRRAHAVSWNGRRWAVSTDIGIVHVSIHGRNVHVHALTK